MKIWRKELVRGRPIVIRHGSKGVTKLQSLGPLPNTQDVRAIIHDCLRHRLMLSYEAQGEGVQSNTVIDEIVRVVALP